LDRFQGEQRLHTSLLLSHIRDVEKQSGAHEALRVLREILKRFPPDREPTLYTELLFKEFELSHHTLALPPPSDNVQCAQNFKVLGSVILVAEYGQSGRHFNFHWSEWFRLFGTDSTSCTRAKVEKEYRELMVKMHPDKYGASSALQQCATQASMIINFGRQLLLEQTQCGKK
jgi:hypothetical protein